MRISGGYSKGRNRSFVFVKYFAYMGNYSYRFVNWKNIWVRDDDSRGA